MHAWVAGLNHRTTITKADSEDFREVAEKVFQICHLWKFFYQTKRVGTNNDEAEKWKTFIKPLFAVSWVKWVSMGDHFQLVLYLKFNKEFNEAM